MNIVKNNTKNIFVKITKNLTEINKYNWQG